MTYNFVTKKPCADGGYIKGIRRCFQRWNKTLADRYLKRIVRELITRHGHCISRE